MTAKTFVQPDNTVQTGAAYKAALEAAIAVMARTAAAFAPHEQAAPDMTVRVDAGMIFSGSTLTEVAAQSSAVIAAPAANPRIDRIVVNATTGVISVVAGTEDPAPTAPAIPSGYLPVCQVLLQTDSAVIANSMITDERIGGGGGSSSAYIEIWLPAGAFKPDSDSPCSSLTANNLGQLEQNYLGFADGATNRANAQIMAPAGWGGTDMEVYLYWTAPTATVAGDVLWNSDVEFTSNNEAVDGVSEDNQAIVDTHQGADKLDIADVLAHSGLSGSPLDVLTLQISRIGADGTDTMTDVAYFLGARVRFKS